MTAPGSPVSPAPALATTRLVLAMALPWPATQLSPNARVHWRARHAAAKAYNRTAWVLARSAISWRGVPVGDGPLCVTLEFSPPSRARRDVDNMLAAMKSAIDGIALALGVDDARFSYRISREEPSKGGLVLITVNAP